MLFRSHRRNGRSILGLAESDDGFHFQVRPEALPDSCHGGSSLNTRNIGVEDPRSAQWRAATSSPTAPTPGTACASRWPRPRTSIGRAHLPDHRSRLPQRGDLSREIRRSLRPAGPSPFRDLSLVHLDFLFADLRFWGESRLVMKPVQYHWDEMKIGPGAHTVQDRAGWLHASTTEFFATMDGSVYRLGVALHDLEDPARVIGVGGLLDPAAGGPLGGDGLRPQRRLLLLARDPEEDGTVKIYWGGADTVMRLWPRRSIA